MPQNHCYGSMDQCTNHVVIYPNCSKFTAPCDQCRTCCAHQIFGHEICKENVYCYIKKVCKQVMKEIYLDERAEKYSVFNGGNSLGGAWNTDNRRSRDFDRSEQTPRTGRLSGISTQRGGRSTRRSMKSTKDDSDENLTSRKGKKGNKSKKDENDDDERGKKKGKSKGKEAEEDPKRKGRKQKDEDDTGKKGKRSSKTDEDSGKKSKKGAITRDDDDGSKSKKGRKNQDDDEGSKSKGRKNQDDEVLKSKKGRKSQYDEESSRKSQKKSKETEEDSKRKSKSGRDLEDSGAKSKGSKKDQDKRSSALSKEFAKGGTSPVNKGAIFSQSGDNRGTKGGQRDSRKIDDGDGKNKSRRASQLGKGRTLSQGTMQSSKSKGSKTLKTSRDTLPADTLRTMMEFKDCLRSKLKKEPPCDPCECCPSNFTRYSDRCGDYFPCRF